MSNPPTELLISTLRLRPWALGDAEAYTDAVRSSHDHLRRFEGWAQAVPTPSASLDYLRWCSDSFAAGTAFVYGVFDATSGDVVGSVGLYSLANQPRALMIGYWTHVAHTNRGAATFAAAAATWAAFSRDTTDTVEVHCDVANEVSARIPRRLGFRLAETRPRPRLAPEELGRALVFTLARADYPRTYGYRVWNESRH